SRIFYTTDGITSPIDTNNPAVKRYTSALSISTNTTVKAVAFSKGYVTLEDSVATAVYAIKIRKITLTAPAESQQFTGNSVNVGWTTENFIAGTDGKFKVSVTGRPDVVTTETSYMITNLVTGSYSVTVALTDMSGNLFSPNVSGTRNFTVDLPNVGSPVISSAGGEYNDSAVVHISCETAGATIFVSTGGVYTEYSGQIVLRKSATVAAYAVKAGMDSSAVVSETYTIIPTHVYDTVKTPVISPVGGKYNDSVVITVTCETAGATIFVSTGGAYTEYSGQRVLRENAVVSAYAMKEGEISEFASRRYTIIPTPVRDTVKTPVISPAGGEYNDSAVVSISCETAGATIFVSTGGAYTEYNGEMVLRENTVVSAYAVKADMDTSAVASETYTIIRLGVSDETLVGTGVAVDVYPNPTNGKFNVVVAVPALIEIFSQSGVCVEKKHVSEKAEFVLVSKGLYLLRATDAKGNVSTKKIIVK
ncbi:MAG: chitobiase/beta-hexosaminidase C-terminal domain-containing protein, partial [Bacteroidales bacterium]|nr:chitobiase/beta-hexosaminidase C-terminal domain-containing protein [Bacteroidales bacterium]